MCAWGMCAITRCCGVKCPAGLDKRSGSCAIICTCCCHAQPFTASSTQLVCTYCCASTSTQLLDHHYVLLAHLHGVTQKLAPKASTTGTAARNVAVVTHGTAFTCYVVTVQARVGRCCTTHCPKPTDLVKCCCLASCFDQVTITAEDVVSPQ